MKKEQKSKQSQSIGNGVFRQQFAKQLQQNLISKDQIQVLSSISWLIIQQNAEQWDKILSYMQQSKAYMIKIAALKPYINFSFQNNLEKIRFVFLKSLTLTNINVQSIQFLQFVNAQKLTTLNLKQNSIVSIRPLQKSVFNFIQKINLEANLFSQIGVLSRLKIKGGNLTNLSFTGGQQDSYIQDISVLVKVNKKSCKSVASQFGLSPYFEEDIQKGAKKIDPKAIERKGIKQVLQRRFFPLKLK